MTKKKIKEVLEKNDFKVYSEVDCIEFGEFTPCGEDWFEHLDFKTANAFMEDLTRRVDNYDVDEEVEVWIPYRGKRGVPEKITDLIHDAEWKLKELEKLLKDLMEV